LKACTSEKLREQTRIACILNVSPTLGVIVEVTFT
jgi:hypothetical protein